MITGWVAAVLGFGFFARVVWWTVEWQQRHDGGRTAEVVAREAVMADVDARARWARATAPRWPQYAAAHRDIFADRMTRDAAGYYVWGMDAPEPPPGMAFGVRPTMLEDH